MNIIKVKQGETAWLNWRAEGISATDIPVILGFSPYKTPRELWMEKTGKQNPPDLSGNPNIQRGHRLEDAARQFAEEAYDEVLLPICAECSDWPILRASLDGFSSEGEPFEFKAPSQKVFDEVLANGIESPTYRMYEMQVKVQAVVVGASAGRLFFYMEPTGDMEEPLVREFRITVSDSDKEAILEAAKAFWDLIQTDTAPELDPERDLFIPASGQGEFRFRALAESWVENQGELKALEDRVKALKTEQSDLSEALQKEMGDYLLTDYAGVKITRFYKKGSVDWAKLQKAMEIPQDKVEAFRKPDRMEARLTLSKNQVINEDVIGNDVKATKVGNF